MYLRGAKQERKAVQLSLANTFIVLENDCFREDFRYDRFGGASACLDKEPECPRTVLNTHSTTEY